MTGSMALTLSTRDLTDLEIRQRIADWVEFYRRSNNLTQADLARMLGKPEGTVSRVRHAKRGAGAEVWPLLRIKLHMSLDTMLDRAAPHFPDDRPLRSVPRRIPRAKKTDAPSGDPPIAPRSPAARSGSGR